MIIMMYGNNSFKPFNMKGYKEIDGEYYYYKIRTNMMFNIPIIHDVLDIPIYSNTNRLYDFEK